MFTKKSRASSWSRTNNCERLMLWNMRPTTDGDVRVASPKLLGRVHVFTKQVGTPASAPASRNCDGVSPTMSRNVRLNVPRLEKPTSMQTSVTLRSVVRSRYIARSTRRRCR